MMSWKDLFKPKAGGAKPAPDPRVRWFGKLPTYADYYSSPADQEWALAFNEWILHGYEAVVGAAGKTQRLPCSMVILRLARNGMTVLGTIQDYGGDMRGRPFPLSFYAGLPTEGWPGPTADRIGPALAILRDLEGLRREVARFCNAPGRFEAVFGGREVDLAPLLNDQQDSSWTTPAGALSLADWFAAAQPSPHFTAADRWFHSVSRWGDRLAEHAGDDFEPTLRFPLAWALPLEPQVAGWLQWLQGRIDIASRHLTLFMTQGDSPNAGYLTVVTRAPMTEDFLLLTPYAGNVNYLDDVCKLEDREESQDVTGTEFTPTSWADFVESKAAT